MHPSTCPSLPFSLRLFMHLSPPRLCHLSPLPSGPLGLLSVSLSLPLPLSCDSFSFFLPLFLSLNKTEVRPHSEFCSLAALIFPHTWAEPRSWQSIFTRYYHPLPGETPRLSQSSLVSQGQAFQAPCCPSPKITRVLANAHAHARPPPGMCGCPAGGWTKTWPLVVSRMPRAPLRTRSGNREAARATLLFLHSTSGPQLASFMCLQSCFLHSAPPLPHPPLLRSLFTQAPHLAGLSPQAASPKYSVAPTINQANSPESA